MNHERLMRQGLLAQKQQEMEADAVRCERLQKDITRQLFMADSPLDLELAAAEQAFAELKEAHARYVAAHHQVRKLREELGL